MKTKERENINKISRNANSGKGVESLNMKFGGNKYDTQFIITGKKKKYFMHGMHKLAVDVTFTQIKYNKGINKYG